MSNISIHKYRIYCETDDKYEHTWHHHGITQCPVNPSHGVTGIVPIVNTIRGVRIDHTDSPYIYNNKSMICDTSGGNIEINMLNAARKKNRFVYIKKVSASNTVTVYPHVGDNIDGNTLSVTLTDLNDFISVRSDGISMWYTIDQNIILNSDGPDSDIKSDTKGDVIIDDGKELKKLNVGNDNDILVAKSSTDLGITWISMSSIMSSNKSNCLIYSCTFTHNRTTPYIPLTSKDTTLTIFTYPGSAIVGEIKEIYLIVSSLKVGDKTEYTIVDNTNSKIITTGTYTTTQKSEETIVETNINNIPVNSAIFELYARTKSGIQVRYHSLVVKS